MRRGMKGMPRLGPWGSESAGSLRVGHVMELSKALSVTAHNRPSITVFSKPSARAFEGGKARDPLAGKYERLFEPLHNKGTLEQMAREVNFWGFTP